MGRSLLRADQSLKSPAAYEISFFAIARFRCKKMGGTATWGTDVVVARFVKTSVDSL
jgi:hypothetical protein